MKPSTSMRSERDAAPSMMPAMMASSKPPSAARMSTPSPFRAAALTSRARRTMAALWRTRSGSEPAPGPVATSGSKPNSAQLMAVAGVELPMPISPVPKQR